MPPLYKESNRHKIDSLVPDQYHATYSPCGGLHIQRRWLYVPDTFLFVFCISHHYHLEVVSYCSLLYSLGLVNGTTRLRSLLSLLVCPYHPMHCFCRLLRTSHAIWCRLITSGALYHAILHHFYMNVSKLIQTASSFFCYSHTLGPPFMKQVYSTNSLFW